MNLQRLAVCVRRKSLQTQRCYSFGPDGSIIEPLFASPCFAARIIECPYVYTSLIASIVFAAAQVVPGSPQTVEVWVVLSEPALASLPRDAANERAELRRRIERQQDDIMAQLAALGAVESARVQQVRNAIAVRLPPAAIESAKKIKGVTGVHAISHRNRIGN